MTTRCTARKKGTDKQCQAFAVNGTDKCRVHGGMTPIKHGLYSKYSRTRLTDVIEQLSNDPDLLDLRQQIALKQALILDKLEALQETIDADDMNTLATLSEKVSKDIERLHKLEYGEKYVLQVEEVQTVINQITLIIRQEVQDPVLLERIGNRLKGVTF